MSAAEAAGFTQTSLERAAGFTTGYLSKLLYHQQDRIDVSKLERLCDLLSCRMHWLATGREPMHEGGSLIPREQGIFLARGVGVTPDVFWFVHERDGEAPERSAQDWASAFVDEHRKRVEDASYARAVRRVPMDRRRASSNPPPSEEPEERASGPKLLKPRSKRTPAPRF